MDPELKSHLSARETWTRGLFILVFALIYSIAEVVLGAVVLFQFLMVLFSGKKNVRLLQFGGDLAQFIYQVVAYLSFTSDRRPYPFAPWPGQADPDEAPAGEDTPVTARENDTTRPPD